MSRATMKHSGRSARALRPGPFLLIGCRLVAAVVFTGLRLRTAARSEQGTVALFLRLEVSFPREPSVPEHLLSGDTRALLARGFESVSVNGQSLSDLIIRSSSAPVLTASASAVTLAQQINLPGLLSPAEGVSIRSENGFPLASSKDSASIQGSELPLRSVHPLPDTLEGGTATWRGTEGGRGGPVELRATFEPPVPVLASLTGLSQRLARLRISIPWHPFMPYTELALLVAAFFALARRHARGEALPAAAAGPALPRALLFAGYVVGLEEGVGTWSVPSLLALGAFAAVLLYPRSEQAARLARGPKVLELRPRWLR